MRPDNREFRYRIVKLVNGDEVSLCDRHFDRAQAMGKIGRVLGVTRMPCTHCLRLEDESRRELGRYARKTERAARMGERPTARRITRRIRETDALRSEVDKEMREHPQLSRAEAETLVRQHHARGNPDDEFEEGNDVAECPACGGDAYQLGALGTRMHYRCRACGWTFSKSTQTNPRNRNVPSSTRLASKSEQYENLPEWMQAWVFHANWQQKPKWVHVEVLDDGDVEIEADGELLRSAGIDEGEYIERIAEWAGYEPEMRENPSCEINPSKAQSILFEKAKWTVSKAKKWLREHGLKYGKVDTTKNYHRFRQRQPVRGRSYATQPFGTNTGIMAVLMIS